MSITQRPPELQLDAIDVDPLLDCIHECLWSEPTSALEAVRDWPTLHEYATQPLDHILAGWSWRHGEGWVHLRPARGAQYGMRLRAALAVTRLRHRYGFAVTNERLRRIAASEIEQREAEGC